MTEASGVLLALSLSFVAGLEVGPSGPPAGALEALTEGLAAAGSPGLWEADSASPDCLKELLEPPETQVWTDKIQGQLKG